MFIETEDDYPMSHFVVFIRHFIGIEQLWERQTLWLSSWEITTKRAILQSFPNMGNNNQTFNISKLS